MATFTVGVTQTLSLSDTDRSIDTAVRDQILFVEKFNNLRKNVSDTLTLTSDVETTTKKRTGSDLLSIVEQIYVNRTKSIFTDSLAFVEVITESGATNPKILLQLLTFVQTVGLLFTKNELLTQTLTLSQKLSVDNWGHGVQGSKGGTVNRGCDKAQLYAPQ